MLAVFHKQFAHPPQELNSPAADAANIPSGRPGGSRRPKNPQEILRDFHAVYPTDSFSATFGGGAALACVVKDLSGSFAFVVYDNKAGTVFAALSSDGRVPLYWGIAADGSVVVCDDRDIIKGSCGKSYAPFPTGCMFHSEFGLKSFEHPMNRMKAMPRVDSEGVMCGANFKVDTYSKVNSMPRVGSAANWTAWDNSL
ncbi:putative asparagine synthetase (glutamine-hydrolyzing), partial [Ananas comosus]